MMLAHSQIGACLSSSKKWTLKIVLPLSFWCAGGGKGPSKCCVYTHKCLQHDEEKNTWEHSHWWREQQRVLIPCISLPAEGGGRSKRCKQKTAPWWQEMIIMCIMAVAWKIGSCAKYEAIGYSAIVHSPGWLKRCVIHHSFTLYHKHTHTHAQRLTCVGTFAPWMKSGTLYIRREGSSWGDMLRLMSVWRAFHLTGRSKLRVRVWACAHVRVSVYVCVRMRAGEQCW